MSGICPKCGAVNRPGRSICVACGAELEPVLFAELFGPPKELKGRYIIQSPLREGAQVSLFRALDRAENRVCLVHQVSLSEIDLDRREVAQYRFLQEAAAWQKRRHPNIIQVLDAEVQNNRLYLVTEPIAGISLRSIIQDRQQSISEQNLLHWADQICDALEYLHSQVPPVILGCMSPATIHIDPSGHVQLAEVGLVRHERAGLLEPARGVPGYAAPEQRRGELTPRSDLYTLGIILYEAITRLDPKERPLPPLRKHSAGFSAPAVDAVAQAYHRDPAKRFASAAEMRSALMRGAPVQDAPALPAARDSASSGKPVPVGLDLPPFELSTGRTCTTVTELIQLCARFWDEGLLAMLNGRILEWLTRSVQTLRQAGQDAAAEQLDRALQTTIRAYDQIASQSGLSQATEVSRNASYARWLQDLGARGVQPSLQIGPAHLDFGVVGATVRATSALQIRNKGQGYLTGRVESSLPWLVVPDSVFGSRAGETAEVRVSARGRVLPSGRSGSPEALHVLSNGGNAWIGAYADSSPPELRVTPQTLDYGAIGRGASRVVHLTIANAGGGKLTGQVLSRAPWLRIRHRDFSCPAGASAQVAVELLSNQLPKGAVRIRRALVVDSDSGQTQIDVAWQWARPVLELDALGLDFGSSERSEHVRRILTLTNSGSAELEGEAISLVDWLVIEPARFRCGPGMSQMLSVTCDTRQLAGGSTVAAEAIAIQANAGRQVLSASIDVRAPHLVMEPLGVEMGTVRDGEQVEQVLSVGNLGSLSWTGPIRVSVPWLTVEPQELSCAPGHFMPVSVIARSDAFEAGGEWTVADAIQIGDGPEALTVAVHIALSRPRLVLERHSLDFGLIGRTDIVTLPLEVANSGTGDLQWRIEVQGTWLEAIPASGTCRAGETSIVQVNAYALAVDGTSGQAWLTVHSNGGRTDLAARVSLSSPLLSVEPLSLDLRSENYGPASQIIRLSNRGVGSLRGTVKVQAPWLTCEPRAFECPTGLSAELQVAANLEGLREGLFGAPDGLSIESNGGSQEVAVRLTLVLTPRLVLSPQALRFSDAAEQSLQLENQGYGTLRIRVVPHEPWISVSRQEWTIKPGNKARVRINLVGAPPLTEGCIEVHAPDQVIQVPVLSGSGT